MPGDPNNRVSMGPDLVLEPEPVTQSEVEERLVQCCCDALEGCTDVATEQVGQRVFNALLSLSLSLSSSVLSLSLSLSPSFLSPFFLFLLKFLISLAHLWLCLLCFWCFDYISFSSSSSRLTLQRRCCCMRSSPSTSKRSCHPVLASVKTETSVLCVIESSPSRSTYSSDSPPCRLRSSSPSQGAEVCR